MPQTAKLFSQRLNSCLDDTGAPFNDRERALILSRMLDIPKQQAWGLIDGHHLPETALLGRIAQEFEVDPEWLTGKK